jgi:prepilin-type N-terminal cleavage/methylation domain-containing protein
MYRRGFSIVELLIVITIMGVLLTLAVVNMHGTQVNARDAERKGDIESIALSLEAFYKTGVDGTTVFGRYPSTALADGSATSITNALRDADLKSFTPPGATSYATGFLAATNNTQTTTGILPQPTISTYVYQPLRQDGTLCNDYTYCQKFNLYYMLEADNTIYTVTSKNQ